MGGGFNCMAPSMAPFSSFSVAPSLCARWRFAQYYKDDKSRAFTIHGENQNCVHLPNSNS